MPNYYNVIDFNATGDGTSDDTTAIQATIDAANNAGGSIVFFPSGTYIITSALTVYSNIIIQGAAQNGVNIQQNSTSENHINSNDVSHLTIRDITFTGPGIDASGGGGISISRVNNGNTDGIYMENVTVHDCAFTGISINCPIVSTFNNVTVVGIAGDGFSFYGSGTSVTMNSCYAITCTSAGYNFDQLNYSVLNSCAVEVCGVGFLLRENCNNIVLIGCGAEDQIFRSDDFPGIDYELEGGVGNSLISCYSRNNTQIGIRLSGGNPTIIGYRQIGNAPYSIVNDTNSHNVTLINNDVVSPVNLQPNTVGQTGSSNNRPTTNLYNSYQYYDTSLSQPIWYDGTNWRNVNGNIV